MAIIRGFDASYLHSQNGMTEGDMMAARQVADRLDEVIIFRSTGPWSKRWLERGYPSKNFHVKGKSSDWGPHAGLVPADGFYSKVGYKPADAEKGTKKNKEGLESGFAGKEPLVLTGPEINDQIKRPEGSPSRMAVESRISIKDSKDLLLMAKRSGDQKVVIFRAFKQVGDSYEIRVYPDSANLGISPFIVADKDPKGEKAVPFYVMTSRELGAGDRPMTGDYDLMAVCPSWGAYGNKASRDIAKPGIALPATTSADRMRAWGVHAVEKQGVQEGVTFKAGHGMDKVMDPRLHTMGPGRDDYHAAGGKRDPAGRALNPFDFKDRQAIYQKTAGDDKRGKPMSEDSLKVVNDRSPWAEHADMGNLTPRILRCINELNVQMGAVGEKAALRRVHHNAESHRNKDFAALSGEEMVTIKDGEQFGDGFPLTVFQPGSLYRLSTNGKSAPAATYGDVFTIESLQEFKLYCGVLNQSGFYVPKNWIWGSGF